MNTATKALLILLPIIGGCASTVPAPVVDRAAPPVAEQPAAPVAAAAVDSRGGLYTVKKGDTLYSIALDNGQDYKDIAAWNNLDNPNVIKVGQQLRVAPSDDGSPVAVVRPITSSAPVEVRPVSAQPGGTANSTTLKKEPKGGKLAWSEDALARAREGAAAPKPVDARSEVRPVEGKPADKPAEKPALSGDEVEWMWPVAGKPMTPFAEGGKGIDIAGKNGDPVLAAAAGVVSYAGAGLRGYGNLVVLRHNATYLSVYAHNSKLLVKEKDTVARGQKIAEMGGTDAESPRLHFEIRRQGKPADPQKFLPPR